MPTLLLPPRFGEDSNALWKSAIGAGWDVQRLQGWRAEPALGGQDPVLYGEPLFVATIADQLGLAVLEPPLDWLPSVPLEHRRRQVRFTTLREARELDRAAFFKPADDKCFRASVYPSGAELPSEELLPGDTPVLVSDVVTWDLEVRCFVLERAVATCSAYARRGELAQDADGAWPLDAEEAAAAGAFAAVVLADERVRLPPAVVLDIGTIAGAGWAIVEANAAWGSGLYGCDPAKVLPAVRRACVPARSLADSDRPWVLARVR